VAKKRPFAAYGVSLALHLAIVGLFAGRPQTAQASSGSSASPTITIVPIDDPVDAPAPLLPRAESNGLPDAPEVTVDGRSFDVDKIGRRRDALFRFLTGDFAFEALESTLTADRRRHLANPYGARRDVELPPLAIAASAIQRLVDRTWSSRDRWNSFAPIRHLIETSDGSSGDLPRLLKTYFDQNILQPYYDTSVPDPRVWVMLGLAADHVDFIDFVLRLLREQGVTRASIELLLLLDKLVQGNRDALLALLSLDPAADGALTRNANPKAYELLVELRHAYRARLGSRGLITEAQIAERYDEVRLTLLTAVIASAPDGYRVNDARYLAGALHWRAGRLDAALRAWRAMQPHADDSYCAAASQIRTLLDSAADRAGAGLDSRHIVAALEAEHGRWLLFSVDPLHQFGFRFDTY
jgi:hypothetical protein